MSDLLEPRGPLSTETEPEGERESTTIDRSDMVRRISRVDADSFARRVAAGRVRSLDWLDSGLDPARSGDFTSHMILDEMIEGVVLFDPNGVVVWANQAWLRHRDLSLMAVYGRRLPDLVPAEERQASEDRLRRLQGLTPDQPNMSIEFSVDGERVMDYVHKGWFNRAGELAMISAVGRDRTESHQAQASMELANRRLEDSNRDLQDFAYVASHDLQEPLRKIVAFSDRLATKFDDDLDERAHDYLGRVQNAASRMQRLIEDLLTFSRVNTDAAAMSTTSLNDVVVGVISDLEIAINEADATIALHDLPDVVVDELQMRQLFQNLIGNGLKFRHEDRPVEIQIWAQRMLMPGDASGLAGEGWAISVADNGIGFDEKYLGKIFTVFQRLHGRNDFDGSGIGLSVCRRIAERHEGDLSAHSVPGQGSTFTLWLPAR